nr:MAG TPA: Major capsid protein [Caudoviricetes sp.]
MALVAKSVSQSVTYEAVGTKDDFSKIITNIDPDMTFFLSNFGTAPEAKSLKFNWTTEGLKPPQENAHSEMTDYATDKVGSLAQWDNRCQHFISSGRVSDAQKQHAKEYMPEDEFARQKINAFKQHARDIEYALVFNDSPRDESPGNPALTGGVRYFLTEDAEDVTFTGNVGATAAAHRMNTGDFIYFKAKPGAGNKLPAELSANLPYYIRKDADPKKFTLYNSMDDAIKNKRQITLSTAGQGVQMVKNNVFTAGDALFTEDHINDCMEMCSKRGGNPTLAVMSGRSKRRFSAIVTGGAAKQRNSKDKVAVNITDVYESDFGTIHAQVHPMYEDTIIDLLDMAYWDLKWFDRTHEVAGLAKKGSYEEFVIESWVGLQGTQPKASGSIYGIKRA